MKRAITILIGVFVTLALILVVLFFPQSKDRPTSIICFSNMKDVGRALLMYAQDYDERLPSAETWMTATLPYTKYRELYLCPEVKKADEKAVASDTMDTRLSGISLEKIGALATRVVIYESTRTDWNAADPGQTFATRHHSKGNVCFLDGHAKLLGPQEFATATKK